MSACACACTFDLIVATYFNLLFKPKTKHNVIYDVKTISGSIDQCTLIGGWMYVCMYVCMDYE